MRGFSYIHVDKSVMNVSVIIPTYNRAKDLAELLDSLLEQTTKPFEVIIIDDNTPNNTIKVVCHEYKPRFESVGSKLVYVRNPRERSLTISRNVGVKIAKEDVIMFFDDDMILYPNYIEKILEAFEKYPNALGVQGWFQPRKVSHYRFFERLEKIFSYFFYLGHPAKNRCSLFPPSYPIILTKIINCDSLCGGCMAFKREVFNEFKFDERLKKIAYMEDDLFSYSIFKKYPKGLFITPYAKCIHKRSATGRTEDKELERLEFQYRKYVSVKLLGLKGALIHYWQSIGITIMRLALKLMKRVVKKK